MDTWIIRLPSQSEKVSCDVWLRQRNGRQIRDTCLLRCRRCWGDWTPTEDLGRSIRTARSLTARSLAVRHRSKADLKSNLIHLLYIFSTSSYPFLYCNQLTCHIVIEVTCCSTMMCSSVSTRVCVSFPRSTKGSPWPACFSERNSLLTITDMKLYRLELSPFLRIIVGILTLYLV